VPRLIKVLLVDDHRLVRAGLQSLLDATDDIRVVGAAAAGREALWAERNGLPRR
jgi:YesN/AraC family two-component response regulator